jgi:hypothetical protein
MESAADERDAVNVDGLATGQGANRQGATPNTGEGPDAQHAAALVVEAYRFTFLAHRPVRNAARAACHSSNFLKSFDRSSGPCSVQLSNNQSAEPAGE